MAHYIETLDFPHDGQPQPVRSAAAPVVEPFEAVESNSWLDEEIEVSVATYEAYKVLYYAFIALPAIAGLDKFAHLLTSWDQYVSPKFAAVLHMTHGGILALVGLIELAIAVVVALKPRIGSWAVTVWLWIIVLNLLSMHGYADIAVCDLTLSAAGYAFTRLAAECN